jgi:hypothetical protein
MAEKENQHYVPKFYLRKFSYKENNKQIGVLNLAKEFYFPTANIKNQASKSYFYGKNLEVEDALGKLESIYSTVIKSICEKEDLPKRSSFDYYLIIQFIILTGLRNPISSETSKEAFDKFVDNLQSRSSKDQQFNYLRVSTDDIKFFVFKLIILLTEMCNDLEYKIIINNTPIPFITSDNPVIKYNQFLEKRKFHGSATGYASLGLQFFLPLNPKLAIIGYDKTIYKIGFNKQTRLVTSNIKDIESLNLLQYSNCYENIYFNHLVSQQYLLKLLTISKKFPKANIGMAEEYPMMNERGEFLKNETISVMYKTDCKTKLDLSFIKETRSAKSLKLSNRAVHVRPHAEEINEKIQHLTRTV